MIPLHKLERLPRSQRLRKIAKIFAEAELRSIDSSRRTGWAELDYLVQAGNMLARDVAFTTAAHADISASVAELEAALNAGSDAVPRRPLNTLRHVVGKEIGLQVADWDLVDEAGDLSREGRLSLPGVRVFLEDIRSPFNVGSMFRTAESFGVERIIISPLCADPEHPRSVRSAMGCVDLVPWEKLELQALQGPIFALETGGTAVDDFDFPDCGVMIVGSEELGVSPAALAIADASAGRVTIPTYGAKGSLNVAVAFGIVMRLWAKRLVTGTVCYPA